MPEKVKYTPSMPLANLNWIGGQPLDGTVFARNADGTLTVDVIDLDGKPFRFENVPQLATDADKPETGNYAVLA